MESNPRPSFGWYVRMSAVAMIALMLVAALRTSFSFGLSAFTSLNQFLKGVVSNDLLLFIAGVEAFCAVLGIEGFIVTTGMKGGMTKTEDQLVTPRAIAAYLLLIVSCVAGLFQNSSLVADAATQTTIEYVLMIATGVGVPVAIMFAAPYLGLMLNFQTIQNARWLDEARTRFENSRERKLARRDLMAEQTTMKPMMEQLPPPVVERQALPKISEIIDWYRKQHDISPGDTNLSAAEIAKWFFDASNRVPVNGDLGQLSGAIRTQLSRERNQYNQKPCIAIQGFQEVNDAYSIF